MKQAKTIAVCNQKGGTGKTNVTVNLGIGLARQGRKVLLIDADPQGDLTTSLGWRQGDEMENTLADLLKHTIADKSAEVQTAIRHHDEDVDLIPANLELSSMEMNLVATMGREYILKRTMASVKNDYDYILIDNMPSLGMLTINALAAADSVLIPVQAQYLPAKGMTQLVKTIMKVKNQINPDLAIDGIILTMADIRTNMTKTVAETLHAQYGSSLKIFRSVIPLATKAAETSAAGKSIYRYDPNSKVAAAYEALTKEVLKHDERFKTRPAIAR